MNEAQVKKAMKGAGAVMVICQSEKLRPLALKHLCF